MILMFLQVVWMLLHLLIHRRIDQRQMAFSLQLPLVPFSMGIPGSWNAGTVPYKAIFCGDIPLHRPYIGLIYGRYLQFRFLKWPLINALVVNDFTRCFPQKRWICSWRQAPTDEAQRIRGFGLKDAAERLPAGWSNVAGKSAEKCTQVGFSGKHDP